MRQLRQIGGCALDGDVHRTQRLMRNSGKLSFQRERRLRDAEPLPALPATAPPWGQRPKRNLQGRGHNSIRGPLPSGDQARPVTEFDRGLGTSNLRPMKLARLAQALFVAVATWIMLSCGQSADQARPDVTEIGPPDPANAERCAAFGPPPNGVATLKQGFTLETCKKGVHSWRQITDRRTRAVLRFTSPPQRIVSQSLGSDEMLFALLPDTEFDRLVAVSALAQSPKYSAFTDQADQVGTFVTDKTEQILALAPDLVFAASYSTRETVRQLENAQVPTLVLHQFTGIGDTTSNLRAMAFALFLDEAGQSLIADLHSQVAVASRSLEPALKRFKDRDPAGELRVLAYGSGSVYAKGTTFNDLAERLGMTNVPAAEGHNGWPRATEEQLIAWQPDLIFLGAPDGSQDRPAGFFQRDFPTLFETENAPKIVLLPGRDFTTVSQRLGTLAQTMADRTRTTIEAPPQ